MLSDIISEGLLGMSGEKSQAEVDYVVSHGGKVLPIEVKASTQGGMQSLWIFLRSHKLCDAVRTSLENFGQLYYYDKTADDAERHVEIIPFYALSNLGIVVLCFLFDFVQFIIDQCSGAA